MVKVHPSLVESGFFLSDLRFGRLELGLGHPELCLAGPDRGGQGLFLGAIGLELRHQRIMGGLGGVLVALGDELFPPELGLANHIALRVQDGDLGLRSLSPAHGQSGARALHICPGPFHEGLLVQDGGGRRFDIRLGLIDLRLKDVGVDARDELILLDLRVEVGKEVLDLPGDLGPHLDRNDRVEGPCRRDRCCQGAFFHHGELVLGDGAPSLCMEPGRSGHDRRDGDREENKDPTSHGCWMLCRRLLMCRPIAPARSRVTTTPSSTPSRMKRAPTVDRLDRPLVHFGQPRGLPRHV